MTTTDDPVLLHKVLAELEHYSIAVDLALSHNLSPAYALAHMIHHSKRDSEDALRFLPKLKGYDVFELARNLIAFEVEVPEQI